MRNNKAIIEKLKQEKYHTYIWGACGDGLFFQGLLLMNGIKVEAFFDNNLVLHNKEMGEGVYCVKPVKPMTNSACILVVSPKSVNVLYEQAMSLGFKRVFVYDRKEFLEDIKSIPDDIYLKIYWKMLMGGAIDLNNPRTYNEKLQWLKINNRDSKYTELADKYGVRTYVTEKIGENVLAPLIGVWDSFAEIDFSEFPNQFVLKCTHDSGSYVVCKDKDNFDIASAMEKLSNALKRNFYYWAREWVYKDIKPRIIAEQFMADKNDKFPVDYKVHCFSGKPYFITICVDRETEERDIYVDLEMNLFNISEKANYFSDDLELPSKETWNCMLKYAEKLAEDIPYIRVDFYIIGQKIYFTELTFYPSAGFDNTWSKDIQYKLGDMIKIEG